MKRAFSMATLLMLAMALAPHAPFRAIAAAAEVSRTRPARIVLVSAPGAFSEVAGRIFDEIDMPGGVEIARADQVSPVEVFRVDGAESPRSTAWMILGGSVARVRAADASRQRFVFRDLAVSEPLTEVDRESLCQVLKSALATVIEGGSDALGRRAAEQALGVAAAPPLSAEPVPEPAPPQVPETLDTAVPLFPDPVPSEPVSALGWSIGARYGVLWTEVGLAHGPGIVVELWSNRAAGHPGAWLAAHYGIERELVTGALWKGATSLQIGGSLEASAFVRVEGGVGVDLIHFSRSGAYVDQPSVWTKIVPAGRAALRFGAVDVLDIPISISVLADVAGRTVRYDDFGLSQFVNSQFYSPFVAAWVNTTWSVHPGVALDLWWR